jgi:hypothetical protein
MLTPSGTRTRMTWRIVLSSAPMSMSRL